MKTRSRPFPASGHYKANRFVNLSDTPVMAKGVSTFKILRGMLSRPSSVRPPAVLPSSKHSLLSPSEGKPVITWFGHSSYLIQFNGSSILVDPVFSGHASPLSTMVKAFPGADVYKPEDMPAIDLLVLTHNHYDHLSRSTLRKMAPKVKAYLTPLGVGADIPDRGSDQVITELDWWESAEPLPGFKFTATPARHFSGRGLVRGLSLWTSYVLESGPWRIFLGGDSGYDPFFTEIGSRFGPFDLAILECGQYNTMWPNIHMMPEEAVQAAIDLHAKLVLPVHWAKFTLANHPWDEPVKRLLGEASRLGVKVTTPIIGQSLIMGEPHPDDRWWEQVK